MGKFINYIKASSLSYGGIRRYEDIVYIVIHYTANKGDTAENNAKYFSPSGSNKLKAGAHYFVDKKGIVYNSVPLERVANAVGGFYTQERGGGKYYKRCTNRNSVSIELCDCLEDINDKQLDSLKELIKRIKKKCKNVKKIIRHWDVNGKECPKPFIGTNNKRWKEIVKSLTTTTSSSSSTSSSSYLVKINVDKLNIRESYTTKSKKVGEVKRGEVYTIIKDKNSWGKLKSGIGWIYLGYTERVK